MVIHPRAGLEAFQRFRFRQETIEGEGIAQISDDDRRDMLANNFVRMTGIDMAARLAACENDEFSQARRQAGGMLPPFSTAPTASSPQDPAVVKA
jgi:hypothetical protein